MAIVFDPRTAFLLGACTAALGSMAFFALQPMYSQAAAALRRYGLGTAAAACGIGLMSLRGALPDPLTHLLANMLACVSIVICADATMRLFERRQPAWLFALQLLVVAGAWLWLDRLPDGSGIRVMTFSLVHCLWSAALAWWLWRLPQARRLPYVNAVRWLFAAYAATHLTRATAAALGSAAAGGALAAGPGQIGFILIFALTPITLALLVQMVLHARVAIELHRRATTDELTGLHSRRHFFELSRQRLKRPHPAGRLHHVLMIDLDHFKKVNDLYGHSMGDHALRHAARILHRAIAPSGFVGRYGGEEFCALIQSDAEDDARQTIEGIRKALEALPLRIGPATITLTASIGAVPVTDAGSLERVLVSADRCVYHAKREGRNRVVRAAELLPAPVV